ncbi:MAG: hypothetical protein LUQ38_02305 [Methanotrichaceae archaeon]|nr:hypothetical protein [Methanotrichaceae archaeon]
MLNDDQAMISLFQDGYELAGGKSTSDFQFSESTMQPAENAGVVAYNKENPVTLQVQVAIEHGYE